MIEREFSSSVDSPRQFRIQVAWGGDRHWGGGAARGAADLWTRLADLFRQAGNHGLARAALQRGLEIGRVFAGQPDAQVATLLKHLAEAELAAGEPAAAARAFEEALAIETQLFGKPSPAVEALQNTLIDLYVRLGDADAARRHLLAALAARRRKYGPAAPETLVPAKLLADICRQLGDREGALTALLAALEGEELLHGAGHPGLIVLLKQVFDLYRELGHGEKALAVRQRLLAIEENHFGLDDRRLLPTLKMLANLHHGRGEDEAARQLARRAQKSKQRPEAASAERRADVPDVAAQPAVGRIGVQPRVPEQGHRERRQRDRQGKAEHSGAQVAGVVFGNAGDQVGAAGERQRGREAVDQGGDVPLEPEQLEGLVDPPVFFAPPRDADVVSGRVAGGGDLALAERVARPHHADETVAEEQLGPQLGAGRLPHHPGFEVDAAVAQRRAVFVELGREMQPHAGSFGGDPGDQLGAEILHETLAGAQREGALEPRRGRASRPGAASPGPLRPAAPPARAARSPAAWEPDPGRRAPAADRRSFRAAAAAPGSSPRG